MIGEKPTEWYLRRKQGIGGSDAAAVLGESRWKTPYEVYLDKTGEGEREEKEDSDGDVNLYMKIGTALEPMIREEYTRMTGREVTVPPWKQSEEIPYICGNIDGLADDRIVEIKTARTEWEQVPVEYYLQVQHYLMLYGLQKADIIACFLLNNNIRIYEIEANPEIQEYMKKIYAGFWNRVLTKNPPDPMTLGDLRKRFPIDNGDSIELSEKALEHIKEISKIKKEIADLEAVLYDNERIVKTELGENQIGVDGNGVVVVTWKTTKGRDMVDSSRLKSAYPSIYQEVIKTTKPSRTFRIKELNK